MVRIITLFLFIINSGYFVFAQSSEIKWTPEEEHWIEQHQKISFGYEPRWEPYEIYENGEYSGIVGEYVKIIEKETGIELTPIPNLNWKQSLDGLRNGTIKMVPCCAVTPSRKDYLTFSDEYIKDPIVIVTRSDAPYLSTLNDLKGKKISLAKNYYTIELIKESHPSIIIERKETIQKCLESVINGESVAFIGNLNVVTYYMNHLGFSNLKVVGTTPYESGNIALAVNEELKPFIPIVNKVLRNIPANKKHAIRKEWIAEPRENSFFNANLILWIIIILSGIIVSFAVLYYWNKVLRKIIKRKKKTEQQLKESLIEIKKKDEEKKVLLQEIHHRVKNNLQVVSSMMRLQSNIVNDPKISRTLIEAVERIKTIALVHDRIYKSPTINTVNLKEYLEKLHEDVTLQFDDNIHPVFNINDIYVEVNMDKIVPLALIMNELITNSIKYAYNDQPSPEINIELSLPKNTGLELIYSDNGRWVENEKSDEFGTSLIEIFTEQLDGVYELNKTNEGTYYHFRFNTLIVHQ